MKRRISSWFTVPVKTAYRADRNCINGSDLRGLLFATQFGCFPGAGVVGRYAGSAGSCWRLLLPAKIRSAWTMTTLYVSDWFHGATIPLSEVERVYESSIQAQIISTVKVSFKIRN